MLTKYLVEPDLTKFMYKGPSYIIHSRSACQQNRIEAKEVFLTFNVVTYYIRCILNQIIDDRAGQYVGLYRTGAISLKYRDEIFK